MNIAVARIVILNQHLPFVVDDAHKRIEGRLVRSSRDGDGEVLARFGLKAIAIYSILLSDATTDAARHREKRRSRVATVSERSRRPPSGRTPDGQAADHDRNDVAFIVAEGKCGPE